MVKGLLFGTVAALIGSAAAQAAAMSAPAEPRSARARPRRREAHSLRIAHISEGFGSADVALDPLLAAKVEAEERVGVWVFRPMP